MSYSFIDKIIHLATQQVGIGEDPPRSSNNKFNQRYYGGPVNDNKLEWCAVFIWWLFQEMGHPDLYFGGRKTASCSVLSSYPKNHMVDKSRVRKGDIVFFDWSGKGKLTQHVGIVSDVFDHYISTIEGNTWISDADYDNGKVMCRTRSINLISKVWRPDYPEEVHPVIYKWVKDVPEWALPSIMKGIKYKCNDGQHLINLNDDGSMSVYEENLQTLVWLDRLGLMDKEG